MTSDVEQLVRRGRIKPGTVVGQDFAFFKWPGERSGRTVDVDTEFVITHRDDAYTCRADGFGAGLYGVPGEYGNGALFVRGANNIEFIDA